MSNKVDLPRLDDVAASIKSTNAGASQITFDIHFEDRDVYTRVIESRAVSAEVVAGLYKIDPRDIAVYHYDPALTIKITIPRRVTSGGNAERDFDGVQQFALLLDIVVPA